MLAMARAVMLNPEVFLLDEPSMGLAPILVDEVFRILQRLKDEGRTMLLVEQFAAAALAFKHAAELYQRALDLSPATGEERRAGDDGERRQRETCPP